jgi:internalin A
MSRIGKLSALQDLELGAYEPGSSLFDRKCSVTDAGLVHLRSLASIRRLGLSHSRIEGWGLVNLSSMKSLRTLILLEVPVGDEEVKALVHLPLLEELLIDSRRLTDAGMFHLAPLTQLKSLHLNAYNVTSVGLMRLKGWDVLDNLWLTQVRIDDYRFLDQFPELTTLWLVSRGRRSGSGERGLDSIGSLSRLRVLHIDGYCAGSVLAHVGRLDRLTTLSLICWTNATAVDYSNLSRLIRLESLFIMNMRVDDSTLAHLSGLRHLKTLSLPLNLITDAGLAHLSALTELESLSLDNSKITDEGLIHLAPLKKCMNLTVRNTGVTGDGFSEFRAKQEAP